MGKNQYRRSVDYTKKSRNFIKFSKIIFFLLFQELYSFMNENVNLLLDFWFSIGEFDFTKFSRKNFTKFFPCWFHEIFFRLSSTNLIQPVTKDIELQDKTPFLLYKIKVISRNFSPLFTFFPDFTKFPLISRGITSVGNHYMWFTYYLEVISRSFQFEVIYIFIHHHLILQI